MKMRKRLKDYSLDQVSNRQKVSGQVLPIQFSNDESACISLALNSALL